MQAVEFVGQRQAIVREKADPIPQAGEVLIRMRLAAICGSDLHGYRHLREEDSPSPWTPGHEPCGEVAELGSDVRTLRRDERVLVYPASAAAAALSVRPAAPTFVSIA